MYDNLSQVTRGFENRANQLVNGQTAWILVAKNSQHAAHQQLLSGLDRIIHAMPVKEIEKFKIRLEHIIPPSAPKFIEAYDRRFTDAIVEILGYGLLAKKYPSLTVEFCEPDLVVTDDKGSPVAAMACKKINESDVNKDYWERHQGEVRQLDNRLTCTDPSINPFLRKVKGTIANAKKQLSQREVSDKFILIDFTLDLHALVQKPEVRQLVQDEGDNLRKEGIRLIACENFKIDNPFVYTQLSN